MFVPLGVCVVAMNFSLCFFWIIPEINCGGVLGQSNLKRLSPTEGLAEIRSAYATSHGSCVNQRTRVSVA